MPSSSVGLGCWESSRLLLQLSWPEKMATALGHNMPRLPTSPQQRGPTAGNPAQSSLRFILSPSANEAIHFFPRFFCLPFQVLQHTASIMQNMLHYAIQKLLRPVKSVWKMTELRQDTVDVGRERGLFFVKFFFKVINLWAIQGLINWGPSEMHRRTSDAAS